MNSVNFANQHDRNGHNSTERFLAENSRLFNSKAVNEEIQRQQSNVINEVMKSMDFG